MKFTGAKVTNFQGIKELQATFEKDKNIIVVCGPNGSGKSSFLDAFEVSLGGSRAASKMPVRNGEAESSIEFETSDGLCIARTFYANGKKDKLVLKRKDGSSIPKPATFLANLVGAINFDPIEFVRLEPKKQAEMVRQIAGVDLGPIEASIQEAFDLRTEVGRDGKRASGHLESITFTPDLPGEESSVLELVSQERSVSYKLTEIRQYEHEAEELSGSIDDLREELARKEDRLKEVRAELEKFGPKSDYDDQLSEISEKMERLEEDNRKIRENKKHAEAKREVERLRESYQSLTDKIESLRAEKAEILSSADLPVPGLTFNEEGVFLDSIPFDQVNTADQIRVSTSVAIRTRGELQSIFIRNASLLDEEGLEVIREMAEKEDLQVFLEIVGKQDDAEIVIENGVRE